MSRLFDPIQLGAIAAPNRVLMAPLTRGRATQEHVPTPIMADYYVQRATAGLIISEATGISREGLGWAYAPGLWTEDQVEGWKPVLDAVHKAGGPMARHAPRLRTTSPGCSTIIPPPPATRCAPGSTGSSCTPPMAI